MEIRDQVFIVTGGASGLGAGTARTLAEAGGKVDVVGKLTIKGITQDVTAPVTFKQEGANQVFEGAFPVKRNAFKVGDGEWKDTSVVSDDVTIKFRVVIAKK